ncbi:MAG: PilZ domain-containing protein [Planctomycetota bacterium]
MENRREHYRIQYRAEETPTLEAGGERHVISDLSISGARLLKSPVFQEGLPPVPVRIRFADGAVFSTTAVFLREEPEHVAIRFTQMIPSPVIFAEERRIKRLERIRELKSQEESP